MKARFEDGCGRCQHLDSDCCRCDPNARRFNAAPLHAMATILVASFYQFNKHSVVRWGDILLRPNQSVVNDTFTLHKLFSFDTDAVAGSRQQTTVTCNCLLNMKSQPTAG